MARTGHGRAMDEHRLGFGHQTLPSGLSAYPLPRNSEHHRSITQRLPELWSDFSDRGGVDARSHCQQAVRFHGDAGETPSRGGPWIEEDLARLRTDVEQRRETYQENLRRFRVDLGFQSEDQQRLALQRFREEREALRSDELRMKQMESLPEIMGKRKVLFVGFAEFEMDGRAHTAGEMDRLMLHAVSSKYPCARPATFDEYSDGCIVGLPARNHSGRDVVFVGPGATGCELSHTNTLGAQKAMVPPGDAMDGTWGAASMYGRKSIVCVYPMERMRRQQSLTQFGRARESVGKSGKLRRAGSLSCLGDSTQWMDGEFGARAAAHRALR